MDIAGLAIGAVSLGLQICGGIITYVDALRGQIDEVDSLGRVTKSFETNLRAIQYLVNQSEPPLSAISKSAVEECLVSYESELRVIEEFVSKLAGCPISNPKFRDKCKEAFSKVTYPFHSERRSELERRIVAVNGALNTSLQTLGM